MISYQTQKYRTYVNPVLTIFNNQSVSEGRHNLNSESNYISINKKNSKQTNKQTNKLPNKEANIQTSKQKI